MQPSNWISTVVPAVLIFTLGWSSTSNAEPCGLVRNHFGILVAPADCEYFAHPENLIPEHVMLIAVPRLHFDLPELVPVDGNVEVDLTVPGIVNAQLKVQNQGPVASDPFKVQSVLEFFRGGATTPIARFEDTLDFPGLTEFETTDDNIRIGTPLRSFNWQDGDEAVLTIFVDTDGGNVGEVWESNERNNMGIETCTIDNSNPSDLCDDGDIVLSQ